MLSSHASLTAQKTGSEKKNYKVCDILALLNTNVALKKS